MKKQRKRQKKGRRPKTSTEAANRVGAANNMIVYDHARGKLILTNRKQARLQAFRDYVTDPELRGRDATYRRPDRNYPEIVTQKRWRTWFEEDNWHEERELFWEQAQEKLLARMEERQVEQHFRELTDLGTIKENLIEYLMPIKDEDGNVIRDEKTGLPKFPLELGRTDQVAKLYLAIQEREREYRGDLIHRTDIIARARREQAEKKESEAEGEERSRFGRLEQEHLSKLARMLLTSRNPKLAEPIETEGTDGAEEEVTDDTET